MKQEQLINLIRNNLIRGACTCGRCADAVAGSASHQPTGHTADLIFFKVALKPDADLEKIKAEFLDALENAWQGGNEHSYLEIGAEVGDQGLALMTMGLGKILGVWQLLTPRSVLGDAITEEMAQRLAGQGMVTIMSYPGPEAPAPTPPAWYLLSLHSTDGDSSYRIVGQDAWDFIHQPRPDFTSKSSSVEEKLPESVVIAREIVFRSEDPEEGVETYVNVTSGTWKNDRAIACWAVHDGGTLEASSVLELVQLIGATGLTIKDEYSGAIY